uniref:tyrosine-protein phosphatase n=1 Tax=Parerythrobacter lutipelagi TaxID=1964208 RepID=UPI0010F98B3A|nr:tyrosine-protein phosphatase [Parerythrobacter lutipelagi]
MNQTDRALPLEGVHNFRDYGGYATSGGSRMKRGLLWRSGQHLEATDADLKAIAALDLQHVIDFRGRSERTSYPCRRHADFAADVVFYDGETAALAPHVEAAEGVLDVGAAHAKMEALYARLPQREPVLYVMRRYFEVLSKGPGQDGGPSLVHCLAGKDRTGMAVALLHHAVGVHPDDAMEDFLLTNTVGNIDARIAAGAVAVREKWGNLSDDTIRVLMGVDERYLVAMRKAVEAEHGSLDAFLKDVLGVTQERREALRLHLTEA